MTAARRVEGYAIVSEDGMLANAAGVMPDALKFEADQHFFENGLDGVDVVVHGRHSHEQQPHSHSRYRLIVTRTVATVAPDPSNAKALFWNPAGTSFEDALGALGVPAPAVGIVGGTEVFGMFLPRYDVFYLTRTPGVRLPGGVPVFPGVPAASPEELLARSGLVAGAREVLDAAAGVAVVAWRRSRAV